MINLNLKGLFTFSNELMYPQGALVEASNVVIDKENVAEPRRGFKQYGSPLPDVTDRIKQLISYKGRLIRHYDDSLEFDDGTGQFNLFSGNYLAPDSDVRIKSVEINGNLFFTTSRGIKKISSRSTDRIASDSIIPAGGVKALEVQGTPNYEAPGFLLSESKVVYRIVWGYRDDNNTLILGSPSPRAEIVNREEDISGTADIVFPIPDKVIPGVHFYQIYRSPVVQKPTGLTVDDIEISDDYNLVFEEFPTSDQISEKSVEVRDIYPEELRQLAPILYSSQNAGEGVNQTNDPPPSANDIAVFRGSTFYANTRLVHRTQADLLGVSDFQGDPSNPPLSDLVVISGNGDSTTYTFVGNAAETSVDFSTYSSVSPFPTSGLYGRYFVVQSYEHQRTYYIWFTDDPTSDTNKPSIAADLGWIGIPVDISTVTDKDELADAVHTTLSNDDAFKFDYVVVASSSDTLRFIAVNSGYTLGVVESSDRAGVVRSVSDDDPAVIFSKNHGLTTADQVIFSNTGISALDTAGATAVTVIDDNNFSVALDGGPGSNVGQWRRPDTSNETDFTFTQEEIGLGESVKDRQIRLSKLPTPGQRIDDTSRSIVRVINGQSSEIINAFYLSGSNTLPGQINFEKRVLEDEPFFLASTDQNVVTSFNPSLTLAVEGTLSAGSGVLEISLTGHGLSEGDEIIVTDSTVNSKYTIVSVVDSDTFEIEVVGTVATPETVLVLGTQKPSDNDVSPNRLYFSKFQQPEAVPLVNFIDVGAKDKPIRRILPLRDSLFVLKDDGIFRIYGGPAPAFQQSLLDNSAIIIAPDSAAILNNKIYMLSTQGVSTVSETGTGIISRPVEDQVVQLNAPQFSQISSTSFAIASESERAYFLWIMSNPTDPVATKCLRFNVFTQAWTEWPLAKTAGIVNPEEDLIYLAPADLNQVEQERKSFRRQDYADREFDLQIISVDEQEKSLGLTSVANVKVGDAFIQLQTVTTSQYNRLLNRLDKDPGLNDTDYFDTLEMKTGDNLTNKINTLVLKLNADDAGASYTTTSNTNFSDLQDDFNQIVNTLNSSASDSFFQNYLPSSGTQIFESIVESVKTSKNKVILKIPVQFIEGVVKHFESIVSSLTWAPQHFGDPASFKQVSQGTFMFKRSNFLDCELQFRSDLSFDFEGARFSLFGQGSWGSFNFSNIPWGGGGNATPVRTAIPRNKQRCRFLQPRFLHRNAFENYELYGLSLQNRNYSNRAYKNSNGGGE